MIASVVVRRLEPARTWSDARTEHEFTGVAPPIDGGSRSSRRHAGHGR